MSLAKKGEKGYGFVDDVLVQYACDSLGDSNQRVVVPTGRRHQVLKLAHSNLVAGHFRFKKTFAHISRRFLWPRMWGEVKEFVRSCAGCQRAARNDNSRAHYLAYLNPFRGSLLTLLGPCPARVVVINTSLP